MAAVYDSRNREIASEAEVNQFVADEQHINDTGTLPESYGENAGTSVPQDGTSVEDQANGDVAAKGNRAEGNYVNPAIFDRALLSTHPGYQPVGLDKTPGIGYSKDVYCNGTAALHVDCKFSPHDIPPNPKDPPHQDKVATGCKNVFCNGKPMSRPGDKLSGKGQVFGSLTKSCYNVYIPNKGLF